MVRYVVDGISTKVVDQMHTRLYAVASRISLNRDKSFITQEIAETERKATLMIAHIGSTDGDSSSSQRKSEGRLRSKTNTKQLDC